MFLEKINTDLKDAMRSKNDGKLRAVRGLKAAIDVRKKEKSNTDLSDEEILAVIQKCLKTRRESASIYADQNRSDLVQIENEEISVLETYLPQQISKEQVNEVVSRIVSETGATSIKDMGKVMAQATKELAGKSDNKTISESVRSLLN